MELTVYGSLGYKSCVGHVGRLGWQEAARKSKYSCDHTRSGFPIHDFFYLAPALAQLGRIPLIDLSTQHPPDKRRSLV